MLGVGIFPTFSSSLSVLYFRLRSHYPGVRLLVPLVPLDLSAFPRRVSETPVVPGHLWNQSPRAGTLDILLWTRQHSDGGTPGGTPSGPGVTRNKSPRPQRLHDPSCPHPLEFCPPRKGFLVSSVDVSPGLSCGPKSSTTSPAGPSPTCPFPGPNTSRKYLHVPQPLSSRPGPPADPSRGRASGLGLDRSGETLSVPAPSSSP